jgi:hypothetical protein
VLKNKDHEPHGHSIKSLAAMKDELSLKLVHFTWAKPWNMNKDLVKEEVSLENHQQQQQQQQPALNSVWDSQRIRMATYWIMMNESTFSPSSPSPSSSVHSRTPNVQTSTLDASSSSASYQELQHQRMYKQLVEDTYKSTSSYLNEEEEDIKIQLKLSNFITHENDPYILLPVDIDLHVLQGPISNEVRSLIPKVVVCRQFKLFHMHQQQQQASRSDKTFSSSTSSYRKSDKDVIFMDDKLLIVAISNDHRCFNMFNGEKLTPLVIEVTPPTPPSYSSSPSSSTTTTSMTATTSKVLKCCRDLSDQISLVNRRGEGGGGGGGGGRQLSSVGTCESVGRLAVVTVSLEVMNDDGSLRDTPLVEKHEIVCLP